VLQYDNTPAKNKKEIMKNTKAKKQWNKPVLKEVLISLESTSYSAAV
jgi:hypothetical protein